MAAAMSTITVTTASTPWVAVYWAGGTATIGVQNVGPLPVRVRVDANAATSDAATAAADVLNPGEDRAYSLIDGDDVVARMVDPTYVGTLTLHTP